MNFYLSNFVGWDILNGSPCRFMRVEPLSDEHSFCLHSMGSGEVDIKINEPLSDSLKVSLKSTVQRLL